MLPNQVEPVTRSIQPPLVSAAFFKTALQKVELGQVQQTGQYFYEWQLVEGSNPDPNEPMYFLDAVAAENWCSLFSGFSQMSCLGMSSW